MSLKQIDSFDGYQTAEIPTYWTDLANSGHASINTTVQRTGAGALSPAVGGVQDLNPQGNGYGNVIVGFGFYLAANPTNETAIYELTSSTTSLSTGTPAALFIGDDFLLYLKGTGGVTATNIAVSTQSALRLDQWYYLEWIGTLGSSKHHQLYVDGAPVFDGTVSTDPTNVQVTFLHQQIGRNGNLYDDFYFAVADSTGVTTALGDSSIFAQLPSGTGSFSQWTPVGSATNWENVAAIPFTSADYNITSTAGKIDTYTLQIISGSGSGVNNYTPSALANGDKILAADLVQRVSSATETTSINVEPFLDIAGSTFTDTADAWNPTGTLFTPQFTIYTTNPIAGAWTGTSINATQWGIEHV